MEIRRKLVRLFENRLNFTKFEQAKIKKFLDHNLTVHACWSRKGLKDILSMSTVRLCAFLMIFSGSMLSAALAMAGGIDPAASQTSTYTAPNGVPVVHIATPNVKGLSHNKYNQFSVDSRGAVLNNTSEILSSQLAGAIRGNSNIQKGAEASIILNEVVLPNRSILEGFIEVHGKSADVIVANPYGITANGLGFINAIQATLTTGVPNIDNTGRLSSFMVNSGDLSVEGKGINAADQSFLNLVVRNLKVDGQINAQNLNLITGANSWNYTNHTVSSETATGSTPAYSIDSTAFGGMYANRINIIATDEGVGVRMLGDVASSTDDLIITAKGTIELKNKISSAKDIDIAFNGNAADGKISISGSNASLTASNNVNISSSKAVEISEAAIRAENNLSVAADRFSDASSVSASRSAANDISVNTNAKTEINGAKWIAGNNFIATVGELKVGANGAEIYSGTDDKKNDKSITITTTSGDLDLAAAKVESANSVDLTAITAAIKTASSATQGVKANNDINLNAKTSIESAGDFMTANNLIVRSTNSAGTLNLINSGRVQAASLLDMAGYNGDDKLAISNQSGGVFLGDTLAIKASSLTNATGAAIQGTRGSTIDVTNTLSNSGSLVVSNTAGKDGILNVGTLINMGTLQGKNNITISANNTLTNSGDVLAENDLTYKSSNSTGATLTNNGYFQAGNLLDISGYLGNDLVGITNLASGYLLGDTASVTASSMDNSGYFQSTRGSTLAITNTLNNLGTLMASNDNSFDAVIIANILDNSGTLAGLKNVTITAANGITNSSDILSDGDLTLKTNQILSNNGGTIQSGGLLTMAGNAGTYAAGLTNKDSGKIIGDNLSIKTTSLDNQASMQGSQASDVDVNGILNNSANGTLLLSEGTGSGESALQAKAINNSGTIQSERKATLTIKTAGNSLTNTGTGKILSNQGLDIRSGAATGGDIRLVNNGRIEALGGSALDIGGYVTNVLPDNRVDISVGSGAVLNGGTLKINAETIDNWGTLQSFTDGTIASRTFNNYGSDSLVFGATSASGRLDMTAIDSLNNQGALHSNANAGIYAGLLTNSSTAGISALNGLTLITPNDFTNSGLLYAGQNLTLTATDKTITNISDIKSGGSMILSSGTLTNYTELNAIGDINITTTTAFNNYMQVAGGTLTESSTTYAPLSRDELGNPTYDNTVTDAEAMYWDQGDQNTNAKKYKKVNGTWVLQGTASDGNIYKLNPAIDFQNGDYGYDGKEKRVIEATQAHDPTNGMLDSNWGIYQYYHGWGGISDYYRMVVGQKKIIEKNKISDGATVLKAKVISGGNLTINIGAGNGLNKGSILSAANTLTINGTGNFTNDALIHTKEEYWSKYSQYVEVHEGGHNLTNLYEFRVEDSIGTGKQPGVPYISAADAEADGMRPEDHNWVDVLDHSGARETAIQDARAENKGTTTLGGIGAGIFATTLVVNVAGSFTNEGNPQSASASPVSKTGASGSSLAGSTGTTSMGSGQSGKNLGSGSSASSLGSGSSAVALIGGVPVLGLDLSLPTNPNGMYVVAKDPNAAYLVESNPKFGLDAEYLGSDYLYEQLKDQIPTDKIFKRLGDAAYENYLITQQIIAQTGRDILKSYTQNANVQTKALFDNATKVTGDLQLSYGVALTQAQVASLKDDIVWMVETQVGGETVLAPVVYLSQATKDENDADDAIVAAEDIDLQAKDVTNTGGTIEGSKKLSLTTEGDITNVSGKIKGGNVALKSTNGSIVSKTLANAVGGAASYSTQIGKTASIEATGNLALDAKKDITNIGAKLKAGENASLKAGRDVVLDTIKNISGDSSSSKNTIINLGVVSASKTETKTRSSVKNIGSSLEVGGDLSLDAVRDVTVKGSKVNVTGNADVNAGRDVKITSVQDKETTTSTTKTKVDIALPFGLGDYESTTKKSSSKATQVGSVFKVGGNLKVDAKQDIIVSGSEVDVKKNATLASGRDQKFLGAANKTAESIGTKQDAGTLGSLIGGINKGKVKTTSTTKYQGAKLKVGGSLALKSGRDLVVAGSDINVKKSAKLDAVENQKFIALSDKTVTQTKTTEDKGVSIYVENNSSNDTSSTKDSGGAYIDNGKDGRSASIGIGIQRTWETTETINAKTTAKASTIQVGGNLSRTAGDTLKDVGTDISVLGGYKQKAKNIESLTAKNIDTTITKTTTNQSRTGVYAEYASDTDATQNAERIKRKKENAAKSAAGAALFAATAAQDARNLANSESSSSGEAGVETRFLHTEESETNTNTTAVTSNIKVGGDFVSESENTTLLEGTEIEASDNISLEAGDLTVKAARNTQTTTNNTDSHESYIRSGLAAGVEASADDSDYSGEAKTEVGYRRSLSESSEGNSTAVAALLKSGGKLKVTTKNDAYFEGTKIESGTGAAVNAGGNVTFDAAKDISTIDSTQKSVGGYVKATYSDGAGGGGGISGATASDKERKSTARAASIDTGTGGLIINSGKDVTLVGVEAKGKGSLDVKAKGSVAVKAAVSEITRDVADVAARADFTAGGGGDFEVSMESSVKGERGRVHEEKGATLNFGSGINLQSDKDLALVGAKVETEGKINLNATGNVDLKAAKSTKNNKKGSAYMAASVGKTKGKGSASASLDVTFDSSSAQEEQGVFIKGGSDLNITSGGKTTLVGTQAQVDGAANISADAGVVKKQTVNKSFEFAGGVGVSTKMGGNKAYIDKLDATHDTQEVSIQTGTAPTKPSPPEKVASQIKDLKDLIKQGKGKEEAMKSLGISKLMIKDWTEAYGDILKE